jgi:pimeloyl-ACP methyl ester carboxylesterase
MSIATLGKRLVHFEALGHGDPLLFLHGWVGSWRYWWPSMQVLSAHHRCFALDLWGFGDSSKDPELYRLAAYVDLVEQFTARLGIARPLTIVGHALGAVVALKFAARQEERVRRTVLISLPESNPPAGTLLTALGPPALLRLTLGKNGAFPEAYLDARESDPQAVTSLAEEILYQDLFTELKNCACPTLLVNGKRDPLSASDHPYFGLGGLGRHQVTLENCGHFPMLDEPARFNRLLLDFLLAGSTSSIAPKAYWQRRTR